MVQPSRQEAKIQYIFIFMVKRLDERITVKSTYLHVLAAQPLVNIGTVVAWNAERCNANATASLT